MTAGIHAGDYGGANLELLGRSYSEATLIAMAYSYEQATQHRTTPALYGALPGDVFPGPGADEDAAGDGSVTVTPSVATATKGQTFTVTVSQDAADLVAYTLTVGYDPKSFTLVGTDVNARGVSGATTQDGSVTVTDTKIGTSPGSEGPTTLVTLTFKATKASSTSNVGLTDLDTANSTDTMVSVF